MAIDNQFRIGELISSGSRAIISKDEVSGNHTFTQGSKKVLIEPYEHIKGERDGELIGRIEKPKYNEEQLIKAVDTDVDELIGPPKKEQPDVVPRPVYEDMRQQFLTASAELVIANIRIQDLESEVATLQSEIETLLIQVDSLNLQTSAAQNEAQATNDRYTLLLQDFANAIVKSTKEGIERVSLKAQTEGLIAQKESLREQLKALNLIVSNLQSQLSGAAAESTAAASGLIPGSDNEFFYGVEGTIIPRDDAWGEQAVGWSTSRSNPKKSGKAGRLTVQNLRDDDVKITKLSISTNPTNLVGKTILGFTDGANPSKTKTTDIGVGTKESYDLFFNTSLGGGYTNNLGRGDEQGTFTITITYDDGSTATGESTWAIRKNRG